MSLALRAGRTFSRSQGLTLIQVRGFQLPALGPSCKSCGGSFCRVFCRITALPVAAADRASGPGLRAPTRTPRTRSGSECMKIGAAVFVHLCCRTRRAAKAPAMEGGSEKEGKVSCASPPPHQSRGEMSQPKGGKNRTEPCTTAATRSAPHGAPPAQLQLGGGSCIIKLDG